MRLLSVILSLYLMVLTLVPCTDVYSSTADPVNGTPAGWTTEHQHEEESADHCTPFCICNCCNTPAVLKLEGPALTLSRIAPQGSPVYAARPSTFISCYQGNIWQPPKIIV